MATTFTPRRMSSRSAAGVALGTFLLGGALASAAAVSIIDDDPRSTAEPTAVVEPATGVVQSADAAERWLSTGRSPAAPTGSADAVDRRSASERAQRASSCSSGSVDAIERCLGGG